MIDRDAEWAVERHRELPIALVNRYIDSKRSGRL